MLPGYDAAGHGALLPEGWQGSSDSPSFGTAFRFIKHFTAFFIDGKHSLIPDTLVLYLFSLNIASHKVALAQIEEAVKEFFRD